MKSNLSKKLVDAIIEYAERTHIPTARLHAAFGVSASGFLQWINVGKSKFDEDEDNLTKHQILCVRLVSELEMINAEVENEVLSYIKDHAKGDWRAALKYLQIRNKYYKKADVYIPEEDDDEQEETLEDGINKQLSDISDEL